MAGPIERGLRKADVGTAPRLGRAARLIERTEAIARSKVARSIRKQIDVMKAAGVPEGEIDAFIRKEIAKRDIEARRERAARRVTPVQED